LTAGIGRPIIPINMDWPALIRDLASRGWTQSQIGERVGVSQSVISDLLTGTIKAPKFAHGSALVALRRSRAKPPVESKAAA
jgi:predicted transcriptional regulator